MTDNELPIESVRNLGPKSGQWLREAGIESLCDLKQLGPVVAYRIVRQTHPKVSLNLLWAMAAGVENRDWRDLTEAEKNQLCEELDEL